MKFEPRRMKKGRNQMVAICARELAGKLGISLRHLWRLHAAGKLPRPTRLGRAVRWLAHMQEYRGTEKLRVRRALIVEETQKLLAVSRSPPGSHGKPRENNRPEVSS